MKTIAELRKKEVYKLADLGDGNIEAAQKIMNSYYRLCGLCESNLYLQNDERTCNTRYAAKQEEKENRWIDRMNNYLKPYGLKLCFYGYLPTIVDHDGGNEAINRYFYE